MPTLREIKGHINSIGSIAQVTRALELISAAKNHRLRERVESTRSFAEKSWQVLNHLASAASSQIQDNPMFCGYPSVRRIATILITSNRGMVGSYNHDVIQLVTRSAGLSMISQDVVTLGRIGREAMLREGFTIHADFSDLTDQADITAMTPIARVVLDGFRDQIYGQIRVAYTPFRQGVSSFPIIRQLLPVCPEEPQQAREYLYEPDAQELLVTLLPRLIRFQIYQAFLESLAAENAARMVAMHAATNNAQDLIEHLSINYNKVRQQSITREITDILGGHVLKDQR